MSYDLGQSIVFGLTVKNTAGTLADLGGGNPTCTLTKPDGTTAAASVTKDATGTYAATYTSDQEGRWAATWDGSGDNSGGLPYYDVADVWPVNPRLIVSLGDVRDGLNMAAGQTVNDDELRGFVVAAGVVIDHVAGAQLTKVTTETWSGAGAPAVLLSDIPATVSTVTENGTELTADTDYCWDEHGILWRGSRPHAAAWSATKPRNVVVTYTAGAAVLPENVRLAAVMLVRHWWLQTQQSARPFVPEYEPAPVMVAGYAVPNMVVDLLKPSMHRVPGVA